MAPRTSVGHLHYCHAGRSGRVTAEGSGGEVWFLANEAAGLSVIPSLATRRIIELAQTGGILLRDRTVTIASRPALQVSPWPEAASSSSSVLSSSSSSMVKGPAADH